MYRKTDDEVLLLTNWKKSQNSYDLMKNNKERHCCHEGLSKLRNVIMPELLEHSQAESPNNGNGIAAKKMAHDRILSGWSAARALAHPIEKRLMAEYFARHDFLVTGANPEVDPRETAASILANPGTTPNTCVKEALAWVSQTKHRGTVMWYTPGALVPATLHDWKEENADLRNAAGLFLFPGEVNPEVESVLGRFPVEFAKQQLRTRFTCALLSAHSFDMGKGEAYFHYPNEIDLQQTCALLYAYHKFLFFDSSKFQPVGIVGYGIHELLETSQAVTIYTVSSERVDTIIAQFETLAQRLLDEKRGNAGTARSLRLCVVPQDGKGAATIHRHTGQLRKQS